MIRLDGFERRRVALCSALGLIVAGVLSWLSLWQLGVLIGWIAAATCFLGWIWSEIRGLDWQATAAVATREDGSRTAARIVLVAASTASLVAVVVALHRAASATVGLQIALTVASMSAVVLSWLVVHTVFSLRYAHLYYTADVGGIEFPGAERPGYREFAYLAFTIGMTFQVSDTAVADGAIRSTVLRHALLSYVFGTAIIASSINVLAGLVT